MRRRLIESSDEIYIELVEGINNVVDVPFRIKIGEIKELKYRDDDGRYIRTKVSISDCFSHLVCSDKELTYDMDFIYLLDESLISFYPNNKTA